ncbi:MAG: sel1 repeat family protein, partial [Alphaproteobacteria bacterium]|nr:sel1 repeat family protein [Alphaproteobacteria bacterium]
LLAGWLLVDPGATPVGVWAKPADCSNASTPGCAATGRAVYYWEPWVATPSVANQGLVVVDRSAFRSATAVDQQKLAAALGSYYRRDWAKAVDILKSASAADPNVQFVTAAALLPSNTTDDARNAQTLLRSAVAAGHRQAGGLLGATLVAGAGGLIKDVAAGRKLIEDAVAAGDIYAMRLAAAGYVSGEFGVFDATKAVELLRKAADAGDPIAMEQLAYCIHTGRGGLPRDDGKVIDYLRRSAEAGYSVAQFTLGRLFTRRYLSRDTDDPSEGIRWYERASQHGRMIAADSELAYFHRFARAAPWFDTSRSFALLQACAPYRNGFCHFWLARAYQDGAGAPRDLVKAYAHFTVSRDLAYPDAVAALQRLDAFVQADEKTRAAELAKTVLAGLKPIPTVTWLQTPETADAGRSP